MNVLPWLIITPLFGAFSMPVISLLGGKFREHWVVIVSGLTLGIAAKVFYTIWKSNEILVYTLGDTNPIGNGVKFPIRIIWEVDLFGALLALTITFVSFLAILYSLEYMKHDTGLDKYYTLTLVLELGMLGIVITGDIFNFYVFLEIMSIASYALVAFRNDTWEGIEAGVKYMFVGSLASSFILLGIALLYGQYGTLTMAYLAMKIAENPTLISKVALAFLVGGLLFKSGAVPVHMWLSDAHPAAPSSISAMLSGLVIKAGGVYAIARIIFGIFNPGLHSYLKAFDMPALNLNTLGWIIIFFACLTLVIGNAMAVVQNDMKRLFAFSSVGQIGYILLGFGIGIVAYGDKIGEIALTGAVYHIVNHAVIKGLLFFIAGAVIHQVGTKNLNELSGLARRMPFTTLSFIIGAAAIIGLPPLNGFASKWLIYESSAMYNPILAVIAVIGTVFSLAAYTRVLFTFLGVESEKVKMVKEPGNAMIVPMLVLVIIILVMGILSWQISDKIMLPTAKMLEQLNGEYIMALLKFMGGG